MAELSDSNSNSENIADEESGEKIDAEDDGGDNGALDECKRLVRKVGGVAMSKKL